MRGAKQKTTKEISQKEDVEENEEAKWKRRTMHALYIIKGTKRLTKKNRERTDRETIWKG